MTTDAQARALLARQVVRQCLAALSTVPLDAPPQPTAAGAIAEAERFIAASIGRSVMLGAYWSADDLAAVGAQVVEWARAEAEHVRLGAGLIDQLASILCRVLVTAERDVDAASDARIA